MRMYLKAWSSNKGSIIDGREYAIEMIETFHPLLAAGNFGKRLIITDTETGEIINFSVEITEVDADTAKQLGGIEQN